jgi:BirA family biotin operon repressor/biotin-[acetyl-CoA-carboxylase] ligase
MEQITVQSIRGVLSRYDVGPFGANVHYYPQIGSTNDAARDLAGQGEVEGTVVMADEQIAGRGRMGRRWVAPPGSSLMFTTIFRPALPPERIYRLVMACGLAAAEGCEAIARTQIDVKWPNDLQIAGRKLAGILPESSLMGDRIEWAIVGMGINVNQVFPTGDELAGMAASLREVAGTDTDRVELLARILARLNFWNARLDDAALLDAWRGRCVTLNQMIQADQGGQVLSGVADELDETGALWLRTKEGERHRLTISEAHILGR